MTLTSAGEGGIYVLLKGDGSTVSLGDTIEAMGGAVTVTGGQAPHMADGTGRVFVVDEGGVQSEWLPNALDLQWRPLAN